eukprot:sb/3463561/
MGFADALKPSPELLSYASLFFSVIFIVLNSLCIPFVTVMFAGGIDKTHLDGVGLANTLYNIIVVSVSAGYSTTFDTYGPPVFGDSTKRKELGFVLVKCILQGALVYISVLGPYLCLVFLLDVLPGDGDTQEFRDIAVSFLRQTCCLGLLDFIIYLICKFFAIQKREKLLSVIAVSFIVVHILLNYLLVTVLGWKIPGLAIAGLLSRLIILALCLGVCGYLHRLGKLTWKPLDRTVLDGWRNMVKLGISGCCLVFVELGLWEAATFTSQFGPPNLLSAILIVFQVTSIVWAITTAVSYASAVLIGRSLGEGNVVMVNKYLKLSIYFTIIEAFVLSLIVYLARDPIVRLFTSDKDVIDMYNRGAWMVSLVVPLDHLQNVLSRGVLVAFGKQRFIALAMAAACYGFCLPCICCVILLTSWNVEGIYGAFGGFCLIMSIVWGLKIRALNYDTELEKTKSRVNKTGAKGEEEVGEKTAVEESATEMKNKVEEVQEGSIDNGLVIANECVDELVETVQITAESAVESVPNSKFRPQLVVPVLFVAAITWSGILTGLSFVFRP